MAAKRWVVVFNPTTERVEITHFYSGEQDEVVCKSHHLPDVLFILSDLETVSTLQCRQAENILGLAETVGGQR